MADRARPPALVIIADGGPHCNSRPGLVRRMGFKHHFAMRYCPALTDTMAARRSHARVDRNSAAAAYGSAPYQREDLNDWDRRRCRRLRQYRACRRWRAHRYYKFSVLWNVSV